MTSALQTNLAAIRLPGLGRSCATSSSVLLATHRGRLPHVIAEPSKTGLASSVCSLRSCISRLRATNDNNSGAGSSGNPGDEDDELDKLLGIGRYRDDSAGFFSTRNRAGSMSDEGATSSEAGDTLADLVQMEVRRVRAKEELMSDLEDRKAQMRAIGEEIKEALAREYELDRMRTEIGANYAISEAFHALDDVEAEVQKIKKQLQADKADLEAWEAQTAEDRSKGLFFKSLYAVEKEPRQPVGKSIPGYWRKQRAAAAATAEAATTASNADAASSSSGGGGGSDVRWDPDAVAAAAQRPVSAASRQVHSPLRLYLFSYLSAFLALLIVNDLASSSSAAAAPPHVAVDALYGVLSAGLGFVAVMERQALGQAQEAMLEGIRRTAGSRSKTQQEQQQQQAEERGKVEEQ